MAAAPGVENSGESTRRAEESRCGFHQLEETGRELNQSRLEGTRRDTGPQRSGCLAACRQGRGWGAASLAVKSATASLPRALPQAPPRLPPVSGIATSWPRLVPRSSGLPRNPFCRWPQRPGQQDWRAAPSGSHSCHREHSPRTGLKGRGQGHRLLSTGGGRASGATSTESQAASQGPENAAPSREPQGRRTEASALLERGGRGSTPSRVFMSSRRRAETSRRG